MSKIKSVKFYWKKANPFAKAKYTFMTNSEQVLWRKDEKTKLKDLEIVYLKDLERSECVIGCLLHNERAISKELANYGR
jgi:hypothetical protein